MPTNAVHELKQIPFGQLIGQPLKSVVEAQALAAQTTVDFIHSVGFKKETEEEDFDPFFNEADPDLGELRNVTFRYKRLDAAGNNVDAELSVPFLSILPIPLLRVDETIIEFNATLSDVHTQARESGVTTNLNYSYDFSSKVGAGGTFKLVNFGASAKVRSTFRASLSAQHSEKDTSRYSREYRMRVYVRAVQDDIPAGLAKVFKILEDTIQERTEPAPTE